MGAFLQDVDSIYDQEDKRPPRPFTLRWVQELYELDDAVSRLGVKVVREGYVTDSCPVHILDGAFTGLTDEFAGRDRTC